MFYLEKRLIYTLVKTKSRNILYVHVRCTETYGYTLQMYGSPCDLQSADESAFTKPIVHNTRKSFASKFLIITKVRRSKRAVNTPLRFREDASSTSSSASEDGRKEKKKGQKAEKPGPGPSKKTTKKAKTKPSVTLVVKKRRTSSPGKGTAASSKGKYSL